MTGMYPAGVEGAALATVPTEAAAIPAEAAMAAIPESATMAPAPATP
jgi:hypothetical protein